MLPAGVTDTVHGDVGGGGDGADGPRPWFIDDDNYTEYPLSLGGCAAAAADDDGDNLSIDLDTFYSLLDNEQPVSSSFQEDVLQANQEKASPPQDGISEAPLGLPLEVEEHEHSQCPASHDLDPYKQGNGLVSSYEASECPASLDVCNQSSKYVKPHDSHLIDTSSSMSHAANWLSLSTSGYKNSLVDSTGCSVVPTVSGFEYQQLQTQSPETLSSDISEYKSIHGSQHAVPGKNFHLGCKKREVSVHGDGESLDVAAVFCKDKTFVSSSNHFQQSQAADSSHFMSVVTYSFGSVHNDVCTNAMLNRGRQEENTCSTAVDSCNDLGANSPNMLNVDMNDLDSYSPNVHNAQLNNGWATEMTWNAWSNLPVTMNSPPEVYAEASAENTSTQFLPGQLSQSFISSDRQYMINGEVKEEDQGHVSSGGCTGDEVKPFLQPEDASFLDSDSSLSEMSCNGTNHLESINPHCTSYADSLQVCFSTNYTIENGRHLADSSESLLADSQLFIQNKKQKIYSENAKKDQLLTVSQRQFHPAKSVSQIPPKDLSGHSMNVDEDPDICIIDGNNVNYLPCPAAPKKSYVAPPYYPRTSSSRCQADDGNLTFQIALQDLAQPKSEASPPEGVLAVPLLRHQRIALSWMVQKETHSLPCSGGILADDQGLGKTVSTIALILMERSPSSKSCTIPAKGEFEALNLDDDDDFPNSDGLNQGNSNMQVTEGPLKSANTPVRQKGRPAAGTLVVCPTSVLRQWADELRNKVTSEANLSFLVYHGSNRTRDPYELAKYDVVLTTYSIVSMEVAMRSTADKSNGKGRPDTMGASFNFSVGKKRKEFPRNLKASNTVDGSLLESTARPLARVGWFRVILDEAQTIKNHRTQVARACWGLRAKRRWCLSGTPIQNAVDDLYSYFRFLKYEPFSVYNSFCSKIKIPINRDPAVGYRKLQAVLKTIMLRRTKGTLLDGKPVINLPPKTIMLKKVDFSGEERAFYSRLEAESREKFKGYADAGTVKQNYVNILLMLLRLRQACDHPLLVKGCDSSSVWRSSLEAAKKIPRDKQIELLNSLETCLALCTICNDPPEDAVVAVCGHVFCNQCISEHLTGEDNFCPSVNCKVKLTGVSVFSKATLRSCLSGLPQHDCPGTSEVTELPEANMSNDSSKIKAAVEILQSLQTYNDPGSRSNYCMADAKCTDSTKIACTTASAVCPSDNNDKVCLNSAKCSNASVSEKAIVYSQWTRMLDLLEVRLKSLSIQYRRLDGTMTVVARDKAVKDFNTLPEVTVMIMSLKAASLGLNMVSACHVLLLDLWWNPTTEDQAIDRAHRIGQTRPVTVSRLTVENTVEDRILALQEKKREMVASAFGEDGPGSRQTRLTVEDLRYLFMA